MDIVQRIMSRVKVNSETGCWEWTGGKLKGGYGQLKVNRKMRQVHRLMYEAEHGTIADGLQCCHACDNPPCCNPAHLFIGTNLDNQRDAARKGRKATGEKHGTHTHPEAYEDYRGQGNGNAKLTEETVRKIRDEYAKGLLSTVRLGWMFGVDHSTVGRIIRRETWKHLP